MKYIHNFDKYVINEKIKLSGKIQEYSKIIFDNASIFYAKELFNNDKIDITIHFGKLSKDSWGSVDLNDIKNIDKGKFKILLGSNTSLDFNLGMMAHEMTHVKQIFYKELSLSSDKQYITWMGENYISVKDYYEIIKNVNVDVYKELPWEKESHLNHNLLRDKLYKSEDFLALKNLNPTMNLIIDSII